MEGGVPDFPPKPPGCYTDSPRRGGTQGAGATMAAGCPLPPPKLNFPCGTKPRSRIGEVREEGGRAAQAAVPLVDNPSVDSQAGVVPWGKSPRHRGPKAGHVVQLEELLPWLWGDQKSGAGVGDS